MMDLDREMTCPRCKECFTSGFIDWTVVLYTRDPGYSHARWICPNSSCDLVIRAVTSVEKLAEFIESKAIRETQVEAPAMIRIGIRAQLGGRDQISSLGPMTDSGLPQFIRELRHIWTVPQLLALTGEASAVTPPSR